MKQNLVLGALVYGAAATIAPNPTTLVRCKNVIADYNYKASRTDCSSSTIFCFSDYWRYDLSLLAGESCFVGPEDFGNMLFEMRGSSCSEPVFTATYTVASYPVNGDRENTPRSSCVAPLPATAEVPEVPATSTTDLIPAIPAYEGQIDLPMVAGQTYDFSAYCDAVISITAPAEIDETRNECTNFIVYGDAGAMHLASVSVAVLASLASLSM